MWFHSQLYDLLKIPHLLFNCVHACMLVCVSLKQPGTDKPSHRLQSVYIHTIQKVVRADRFDHSSALSWLDVTEGSSQTATSERSGNVCVAHSLFISDVLFTAQTHVSHLVATPTHIHPLSLSLSPFLTPSLSLNFIDCASFHWKQVFVLWPELNINKLKLNWSNKRTDPLTLKILKFQSQLHVCTRSPTWNNWRNTAESAQERRQWNSFFNRWLATCISYDFTP